MTSRVAVVIVNHNCRDDIAECVGSVLAESRDGPEIVVVDNASTDDSMAVLRRRFPGVRVILNTHNVGLAAANNQGIAATSAPYILMCNPDIRCRGDTVRAIAQCFDRHERAALVGARLFDESGNLRSTVADLPRLRDGIRGRYWWSWWPHDEERVVGQVTEACYAVRREAVAHVGGLDAGFFLYWEGADWSYRFAQRGWETWFCPSAEAVHIGGATVNKRRWRRIVWSHRGAYRFFKLHSRVPAGVLVPIFSARAVVKLLVEALVGTDSQTPLVQASRATQGAATR